MQPALSESTLHLRDLVAIPSVNPMGREDLPAEITGEEAIARHLQAKFSALGLDTTLVGRNGRLSVIAQATADPNAETVLIASHLDTVPVDSMAIDPFDPQIHGDQLQGRGSCDTKAGMAALLAALRPVLQNGQLQRNLIVVGEADEELGSIGVDDVLQHLGPRRPDWVLATEPTDLRLIHAHKGVVHARLCAKGRACHSSEPELGRNAISILARAILALEKDALLLSEKPHPQLGPGTLSIGIVQGGQAPNIVPDEARLWVDRRTLPRETAISIQSELEESLRAAGLDGDVFVETCTEEKPPLGTEPSAFAVSETSRAMAAAGIPSQTGSVAFGTDAGVFARAGIPGVVLGPGSIRVAHTANEFVPIPEVETMVRVFKKILTMPTARQNHPG